MGYKCKYCGWRPEEGSFGVNDKTMREIFAHEKTHPENKRTDCVYK